MEKNNLSTDINAFITQDNFRYQRLKLEISEFSADLEKLKTENVENANSVKLAEEVCYMLLVYISVFEF